MLNSTSGQAIQTVLQPTMKAFVPFLLKNKAAIQAIPPKTETYGSHSRQKLDVYLPKEAENSTILVFFHGGGLVFGDKIIPVIPEGLVYANLGAYYASRGLTTIIPNYRRVNFQGGGEDAVYPSGGEDVSLVMKWLETFAGQGKRDVYIMGNSAGGIHISTFLFGPSYLEQRKLYASGKSSITLRGVIEQAVPFHFKCADPGRHKVLETYFGTQEQIKQHCPFGLLEAVTQSGSREDAAVPKILVLLGEYDPEDEIGEPVHDFVALWKKTWGDGIDFEMVDGHNHISPQVALMSNDAKAEKWAEDVVKWIKGSSS